ncbi:MAG: MoaD/ThiS family protein [Deltaproteobacteria bacterium]|nr:MoaD/ThiS family protein [Deltaproteobacteria bacterium]
MALFVPHASLAKMLGATEVHSEAETVGDLLQEVRSRVSPEEWKQASRATVLLNGRNIYSLKGLRTRLRPPDEGWMVVPAAGG